MDSAPRSPATREHAHSWPVDVAAILVLLAALLVYFQYNTLAKFSGSPTVKRFSSPAEFFGAALEAAKLNLSDALVAFLILIACASLLVLELRERRLTRFFDKVFESESRTRLFLALSSLILVRFYFAPGESSWVADTNFHNTYAWITSQSFSRGEIPIWTNYLCTGSPFLQFYGFLFFYLVGLFDLVFRDIFFSIKWVLALAHVASGVGMYLFVSSLLRSRRAGFLAGIAFVLTFWHTQHVLMMGRLPLSVFYGLLPWPFYFCERLRLRSRRLPSAIGGAITLACLVFTHPGYGFWAAVFLAVHLVLRPLLAGRNLFTVSYSLLLFCGGLVLSAYLVLPMWAERAYTGLHAGFSMSHWPRPTWQHLLYWSNHSFVLFSLPEGQDHWYGGYLGISLVLLCLGGLVAVVRLRRHVRISAGMTPAICLALSLILVFGYDWPVLRSLDVVQALHAGRYLIFVVFFASVLAGFAVSYGVSTMSSRDNRTPLFVFLLATVVIDLGPATFLQPYYARDVGDHFLPLPAGLPSTDVHTGELPNVRIYSTRTRFWPSLVVAYLAIKAQIPSVYRLFDEYPLVVPACSEPFEQLATPLLEAMKSGDSDRRRSVSDEDVGLLAAAACLLNIEPVLIFRRESSLMWDLHLPYPSPIVVSPVASNRHYPVEDFASLDDSQVQSLYTEMIRSMGVDPKTRTCRQIFLRDLAETEELGTAPEVEVLEHRVWNQRVKLHLRVTEACFARLAYARYPYLDVILDGEVVEPFETVDRFIALRLSPGEHHILLEPRLSPLRRGLLILDLLLLAAAGVALWRNRVG